MINSDIELIIRKKLLGDYNSIYVIDYVNATMEPYFFNNAVSKTYIEKLSNSIDYYDTMNDFSERYVLKEDKTHFLDNINLERVKEGLDAIGVYSHRFVRYNVDDVLETVEGYFEKLDDQYALLTYHTVPSGFLKKNDLDTNEYNKRLDRRKKKILIVEDNELVRIMLRSMLDNDYVVYEAENGLIGLEILRRRKNISAVLLDIQMPVLNGYDFMIEVKKDENLQNIPVIITAAEADFDLKCKFLELGAVEFIAKPYIPAIVLGRLKNIINLKEASSMLASIEYDEKTGVYTKSAFEHHAQKWMIERPDLKFDIIVSDVVDYKELQDTYGRIQFEAVLRVIARRLSKFPTECIVGRYSTDIFIIMCPHIDTYSEDFFQSIDVKIAEHTKIRNAHVKFGIYPNLDDSISLSLAFNRALATEKTIHGEYGKVVSYYNHELQNKIEHRMMLESKMEQALLNKEFFVYYQPKHDAKTGEISGAEALVRWINPEFGFVSPGDFIPLFEENGFVSALDKYVLEVVCSDINDWKKRNIPIVPISINTSRRDFFDDDYRHDCLKILKRNNVSFDDIHMEITESHYTSSTDIIIKYVEKIRKLGIQIEMDDFGVGYSSLGMIKKLPLDIIKLDMSFVRNLELQLEVVETIIYLAHKIGCKVVAEGVETEHQLNILKNFDCDYIQGYYFSKPIPKPDFEKYVTR